MFKIQQTCVGWLGCAVTRRSLALLAHSLPHPPPLSIKYYCAGVDLSGTIKPMHPATLHDVIRTSNQRVFDTFLKFPKPLIAAVNGPAIGASVTTTTLCDYTIASDLATFSTPFARLGVPPEGCSSVHFEYLMGKEEGQRMLGDEGFSPTGAEAADIGLVKEVVSHKDLMKRAEEIAREWIADEKRMGEPRSHMGYADTRRLLKVNEKESQDLADAFLSDKFLRSQASFLESKKKTVPSLIFKVLVATRPAWKRLLPESAAHA